MCPSERRGNWRVTSGEDSQEWLSHVIGGIGRRELTVESSNFPAKPQKGWATLEVSLGIEGPGPARYQQVSGRLARFRLWAYRSEWNSFAAGFAVLYRNEEERLDGQRVVLRALSYVRCRSWGALFAALGRSAHRTTRRPEAFCG